MNTLVGYSSDDSDISDVNSRSAERAEEASRNVDDREGSVLGKAAPTKSSTPEAAASPPASGLASDNDGTETAVGSLAARLVHRASPHPSSPLAGSSDRGLGVKGTLLGVKRAGSPAGSSPSRHKPNPQQSRQLAATSSLKQELLNEAQAQDTTGETIVAGPSRLGSRVLGDDSPSLLRLLAPPPLVKQDGEEDAEWGLGQPSRGEVDPAIREKLATFHGLKAQGTHFNVSLSRNRQLRNPHIFDKLVKWVDVDEGGTLYPESAPEAWAATRSDRRAMLREGGKDQLAAMQKRQQQEREAAQTPGKARAIAFSSDSGAPDTRSGGADVSAAAARSKAEHIRASLMHGIFGRDPVTGRRPDREEEWREEREERRRYAREIERRRE